MTNKRNSLARYAAYLETAKADFEKFRQEMGWGQPEPLPRNALPLRPQRVVTLDERRGLDRVMAGHAVSGILKTRDPA